MTIFKKAIKIAQNDCICLVTELRFKLCILLVFLFTNFILEEVNDFAFKTGYSISVWLLPFILNQRFMRVILYSLFLFLICEVPFMNQNNNQMFLLIRSGKFSFFMGKILFLFFISIFYSILLCISSIVCIIRHLELTMNWGKVLGTLSLTDASSGFDHSLQFNSQFILKYIPQSMYLTSFILFTFACFTLGMLVYVLNILTSNRLLGNLIATILILFDFLLVTDIVYEKLIYISPLTWSNTAKIDLYENLTVYPSLFYVISSYILINFIFIIIILISQKNYSVD